MNMVHPSNPDCLCVVDAYGIAPFGHYSQSDGIPSVFEHVKKHVSPDTSDTFSNRLLQKY